MVHAVAPNTVGIKGKRQVVWTRTRFSDIPGFVKAEMFEVRVIRTSENTPVTIVEETLQDLRSAHDRAKYYESWITGDFMYRSDHVIKIGTLVTTKVDGKERMAFRVIETGHIDR